MIERLSLIASMLLACTGLFAQGPTSKPSGWTKTVVIDPAGPATEKDFMAMLKQQGLETKGTANFYSGRFPEIDFIGRGAMAGGDLEFFYEKPFRYYNQISDFTMEDGGKVFGIRTRIHCYKESVRGIKNRSFLLVYRCDNIMKEYRPSCIFVNGRKVYDARKHPAQGGRLLVPFSIEDSADPFTIDFVCDREHAPELKGIAFRMFFVYYLGDPGVKVDLKDAADTAEGSPADKLEKFAFGLFPSDYDFWAATGPKVADIKKDWKQNFTPAYPKDDVYISPCSFDNLSAKDPYNIFMMTYGGCNTLGYNPPAATVAAAKPYTVGIMANAGKNAMDPAAAKKALELAGPGAKVLTLGGEMGVYAGGSYESHMAQMNAARKIVEDSKKATGAPERMIYMYEPWCPGLNSAYEYERGADLLVLKNEENPQYNIMMSMARGAGRSFGKPFGYYVEPTLYPYPGREFKLHFCLLYYFSGGSWIGAENENAPAYAAKEPSVADWTLPYVQAMRLAMIHPNRGEPVVPIGIVWSYGDRWTVPYNPFGILDTFLRHFEYNHADKTIKTEPSFIKTYPWIPKDKSQWNWNTAGPLANYYDFKDEMQGYDLLDVFFPKYGDAFNARIARMLTGTPYGPVDFVYANAASADLFKSYNMLAILGHANMTKDLEAKLTGALQAGKPVLLGAQHFKDESGKFVEAFGITIEGKPQALKGKTQEFPKVDYELLQRLVGKDFDGGVYAAKAEGLTTLAAIDGKPILVSKKVGEGVLYVFLGEWMHQGENILRPVLEEMAKLAAPLHFTKADDQIEYVIYKKNGGAIVTLFNHGNISVGGEKERMKPLRATPPEPLQSELKGPYDRKMHFAGYKMGMSTDRFDIYEVAGLDDGAFDGVISGNKTFTFKKVEGGVMNQDGSVKAPVKFSKRAQYVLVPVGKTPEEVFFGVAAAQPVTTAKPAER